MARPNQGPKLKLRDRKGARSIYEISWYVDGKRHAKSTNTDDYEEACHVLSAFLNERDRKTRPPHKRPVSSVLAGYWREHGRDVQDSERIRYAIDALKAWWTGTVDEITVATCKRYVKDRGIAAGTARRELGVLQAALRHDWKARRLGEEVPVWKPKPPPPNHVWLARDEAAHLLWIARRTKHLQLFILISLYTGARSGAVLELTWDRVDLKRGLIDFGNDSGNKRRAKTPIARPLLARLKQQDHQGHVISYNGQSVGSIKKSFARACAKARLNDVTPHVLRHTAVTWLVQKGVPLWEVAGFVGMSVQMIAKVYGHHSPDFLKNAKAAME